MKRVKFFQFCVYLYSKLIKKSRGVAVRESFLHPNSRIQAGSSVINSSFDRLSFCGYDCTILNCEIGAFCSIASRVSIGGVGHPMEFVSTSPAFLSHKDSTKIKFAKHDYLPVIRTFIGSDVWIGEGAFLKAGVRVGHGAVIGMGAVVTHDVAPYAIVGGNPARLIRFRFDQTVIDGLLASRWWEEPNGRLHELGPYMHDPLEFLKRLKQS